MLGVIYAWVISPVEYVDIIPSSLSADGQNSYRAQIALAYQATGNLDRARQRLALLGEAGSQQALAAQAQRIVASDALNPEGRALALLASDLSPQPAASPTPATPTSSSTPPTRAPTTSTQDPVQAVRTATRPPSPTPSLTPQFTYTPRPTVQPTATLGAPFALKDKIEVCDQSLTPGLLQVEVLNSAGQGVGGVKLTISSPGGEENFFTGLIPELGPGYADFLMAPQVTYAVRAGDNGGTVTGLSIIACKAPDGSTYSGGYKLRFSQ